MIEVLKMFLIVLVCERLKHLYSNNKSSKDKINLLVLANIIKEGVNENSKKDMEN